MQRSMGLEALGCFNLSCVTGQCLTLAKQPVYSFNTFLPHSLLEMQHSLPSPQRLNSLWTPNLSDNCYSYFQEKTPYGKFVHCIPPSEESSLFAEWIWGGPWLSRCLDVNIVQVFGRCGHQVLFKLFFECFVPCHFQLFEDWAGLDCPSGGPVGI